MTFKQFWKQIIYFSKSDALTEDEIASVRRDILEQEAKGNIASSIITYLQNKYPKLSERYEAERAYWTEVKKIEQQAIVTDAKELDITKFRIIPSPNACELCIKVSGNGNKVFDQSGLVYKGQKIPPIHPQCYCVVVPE